MSTGAGGTTYGDDSSALASTSQGGRVSFGGFGGLEIRTGRALDQKTLLIGGAALAALFVAYLVVRKK